MRPSLVHKGLAVYATGLRRAGATYALSARRHRCRRSHLAELIEGLRTLGRKIITFDPPGAGCSTQPMRLGMPEMLECAEEALTACCLEDGPVDVMGHRQGGFSALAFTINRPERVRRLILAGAGPYSGSSQVKEKSCFD